MKTWDLDSNDITHNSYVAFPRAPVTLCNVLTPKSQMRQEGNEAAHAYCMLYQKN